MITSRTWTMSITQMLRSPLAVLLTIASCVAGAPVQIEGENIGLGQAVFSQPELAEALARTYEALEWQERIRENQEKARTLDHIGGGNLLRNLDRIGGGNLLRDLDIETNKESRSTKNAPSKDDKFNHRQTPKFFVLKDDPSIWPERCGYFDVIGSSNIPCHTIVDANEIERNINHNSGRNLLRDLDPQSFARSILTKNKPSTNDQLKNGEQMYRIGIASSKDMQSEQSSIHKNSDSLDGRNIVRSDSISLNEIERNLDHIGGGHLLRDLNFHTFARLTQGKIKPLTDDQIRQYSTMRRGEPEAHGLDTISSGNVMQLSGRGSDSLSGGTFGESKRFDPHRKQNEPTKQNVNWPNIMNREQFDSSAKRNFDEIDRTNFDSFVKRNFDEIDRTGWNSFVKRRFINAYLASRHH